MLIVPDADTLNVEVKIAPQEIEHVHPGQAAIMRFSTFNQHTTPEITGEVNVVSAGLTRISARVRNRHDLRARLARLRSFASRPPPSSYLTAH
jgi:hypothetical protein